MFGIGGSLVVSVEVWCEGEGCAWVFSEGYRFLRSEV